MDRKADIKVPDREEIVTLMEPLLLGERFQPDLLQTRTRLWAEEEIRLGILPSKSGMMLDAILYRGTLPRDEVESRPVSRVARVATS